MGTPTFEEQVNTAINSMTEVEGKQVFAEGVTDDVKFAANAVRRQKDTQAAYTKNQQELKALTSENEQLASSWAQDVTKTLTVEQQSELEELKHSDPEAWREKVNTYEQENATTVQTKHSEIKKKANEESELDRRTRVLEEFNTNNPTIALTDDVIENDVPPRFSKQLATGEITFEEFINKVGAYLTTPKKIADGEAAPDDLDLTKLPGGSKPSTTAVDKAAEQSYKTETY